MWEVGICCSCAGVQRANKRASLLIRTRVSAVCMFTAASMLCWKGVQDQLWPVTWFVRWKRSALHLTVSNSCSALWRPPHPCSCPCGRSLIAANSWVTPLRREVETTATHAAIALVRPSAWEPAGPVKSFCLLFRFVTHLAAHVLHLCPADLDRSRCVSPKVWKPLHPLLARLYNETVPLLLSSP